MLFRAAPKIDEPSCTWVLDRFGDRRIIDHVERIGAARFRTLPCFLIFVQSETPGLHMGPVQVDRPLNGQNCCPVTIVLGRILSGLNSGHRGVCVVACG